MRCSTPTTVLWVCKTRSPSLLGGESRVVHSLTHPLFSRTFLMYSTAYMHIFDSHRHSPLPHTNSGLQIRGQAQNDTHSHTVSNLKHTLTRNSPSRPPPPHTHSCLRLRRHAHRRDRGQAKGGGRKDHDQAKQRRQERAAAAEGGHRRRHEEAAGRHPQDPGAADEALIN